MHCKNIPLNIKCLFGVGENLVKKSKSFTVIGLDTLLASFILFSAHHLKTNQSVTSSPTIIRRQLYNHT